jgi:protein-L-isoaspartate(D-aspartate) O-methyltransferase
MTPFESLACAYFVILAVAIALSRTSGSTLGHEPADRVRSRSITAAGAALLMSGLVIAAARWLPADGRAWLAHLYLVSGYWIPALAATARPGARFEAWLIRADEPWQARLMRTPRWLAALGEAAYLLCYPFVPAAFALVWRGGTDADVERFWLAVLAAGYACYGSIPWLVARPPRLVAAQPAGTRLARVNVALLSTVSHNLTTFPSGHVAVSIAATLTVVPVSSAAGVLCGLVAAGIAVGAATGRYHYVVDVKVGLVVGVLAASAAALAQRPAASHDQRRMEMVERQIEARGVLDRRVLDVMRTVPRERFVPAALAARAYDDNALPIGQGQTISQPYIVAHMTELLRIAPHHTVLEIGTGSGYQAAILGELAREVYTIEIVSDLAQRATRVLAELGYRNVHVRDGDGYAGWPEHAPFDRVLVTAAPERIPQPLVDQLAPGGLLVAPVGAQASAQWIVVLEKTERGIVERRTIPVQFVPFTRGPTR